MRYEWKRGMRRTLCLTACLLMSLLPALGAAEGGSWDQINQSVKKGEGWQRIVTDPSAFQLGEAHPLEGQPEISVVDWGSYPSLDGSTVCVPLAMELARQWLDLSEEDLNGFVNFSTTPYAYERDKDTGYSGGHFGGNGISRSRASQDAPSADSKAASGTEAKAATNNSAGNTGTSVGSTKTAGGFGGAGARSAAS